MRGAGLARQRNCLVFPAQVRKQDHVANIRAVGQQHDQTVDTNAAAARRGHAVFERANVIGVEIHGFLVTRILLLHLLAEAESGWGVENGGMAKEHHGYLKKTIFRISRNQNNSEISEPKKLLLLK